MKPIYFLTLIIMIPFHSQAKTVVFIGDSLTAGYGLEKEQAFPYLIEQKLKKEGLTVKVINGGVSGSTSASGTSRLKWFLKAKPDVIFLCLGANDGLRGLSLEALYKNLSSTISLAKSKSIPVILGGIRIPNNYGTKYSAGFSEIFPKIAKEFNLKLIPFLLEGVAGKPELNLPDQIHPNEKGHIVMAETVYPYIKKALQ